ncbi:MAG TPA: Tol-Pal system beta propeller repeat protein TolB [Gammaproteobacteria bacterium]|nr:Tol-Pal system beta propeller repeat protein TolB [Gammaproteobacteria bacterium]
MKRLIVSCLFLLVAAVGSARAELTIQVTGYVKGASPIAIVPFGWKGGAAPPQRMAAIIGADLHRSGRFQPLADKDLVARPHDAGQVDFGDWRKLDVDSLVVGRLDQLADGRYQAQFQLLDVATGKQLAGYSITSTKANLRQTAHQISDIIYQTLTGERGAFDTHIAYVTVVRGKAGKPTYRLAVADADGYNEQVVYESSQPILSPAWSPDGTRLAYVSFASGRPAVYIQNILTRHTQKVAAYQGLNNAPAFSPDGRRLALTLSKDGNADIYVLDLASKTLHQITHSYAIDTEAAWMPDGKSLVFTSDRGGSPQLYQIGVGPAGATGQARRLTFDGNYNARAAVSPDGKKVAMIHGAQGAFRIAVLDLAQGYLQVLTDSRLDESPSFSPNGSMIIYASQRGGRGVLRVVSVDGRVHQSLSLRGGDVREPAWSPFKN